MKKDEERRDAVVNVRMTAAERGSILRAAAKDQRPVAAWARLQLLKAAGHKSKE